MKEPFDRGGGIPRFLFKQPGIFLLRAGDSDSAVARIEERQTFALNDLVRNPSRIDPGNVASDYKSLWSLYHLKKPDQYHANYSIELCSKSGRQLLLKRLIRMDVDELWDLHDRTNERFGTLRGIRFEAYAHKKIMADGLSLIHI